MKKIAVVTILALMGSLAHALINPNFTPVQLVKDADLIVLLKVNAAGDTTQCKAEVKECFKPKDKPPTPTLVLELKYARKEMRDMIKERLSSQGDKPVLLFSGKGENGEEKGFLHVAGKWLEIEPSKEANTWDVLSMDARSGSQGMGMEATWAGGTDSLLGLVRLLVAHEDMTVPVDGGTRWETNMVLGKVEGRIARIMAVDLAGQGGNVVFVAAEKGDRLFQYNRQTRTFSDISSRLKLESRSRVAAWGDFNGDGRLDLASSDGASLSIWSQGVDGLFTSSAVAAKPEGNCVSLQVMDVGVNGRAGLVWSSAGSAVLLVPDKEKAGMFALKPLAADPDAMKAAGPGGKCLVADFDGDSLPDVIQVGAQAGVFYKARALGDFEAGKACAVAVGSGNTDMCLGDFDADGKIDVFTVSSDGPRLWQNEGGGRFVNMQPLSGELAYIPQPNGISGNTCDINNDGRQDLFIAYSEKTCPEVYFNRIFRSFGHAHQPVDINELDVLPEAKNGQQAGVIADFTDDGAQDMVFALANGEIRIFIRSTEMGSCLAARVALPVGASTCGPVMVTAHNGVHSLGAWAVVPGTAEAFLGRAEAGEITYTWQLPGGAVQKKPILLEDKPRRILIPIGK